MSDFNPSNVSHIADASAHARHLEAQAASRAHRRKRSRANRVVTTGAFVLLGAVLVLGAASLAALIAGYEPPGYEKEARRVRRFALDHKPDFSRTAEVLKPVGRQFDRGERWVRRRMPF